MNESLEDAIKEAYAIAPAGKSVIHTLEIKQDGVQPTIYIAQSRRPITAIDENSISHDFEAVGFQFTLPPVNEDGFQSLNIAIDNVGRRVNDFIEAAKASEPVVGPPVPVEIIYRPYLSDDLSAPQMNPPLVLYLKEVSVTATQVNCRATFMDLVNKPFPNERYTRERFPTLG